MGEVGGCQWRHARRLARIAGSGCAPVTGCLLRGANRTSGASEDLSVRLRDVEIVDGNIFDARFGSDLVGGAAFGGWSYPATRQNPLDIGHAAQRTGSL